MWAGAGNFSSSGVVAGGIGAAIVVERTVADAVAVAATRCGTGAAACGRPSGVGSAAAAGAWGAAIPRGETDGRAERGERKHEDDDRSKELRGPLRCKKSACGLPRRRCLCLANGLERKRVDAFGAALHGESNLLCEWGRQLYGSGLP